MDIPLKIVQSGLTEEYVAAKKRVKDIEKKSSEIYKKGTELQEKVREIWIQQAGRNYSVRHPARMQWREAVALHDLTKEFLEINGLHQETERDTEKAKGDIVQLYIKSGMKWSDYGWV